MNPERWKRIREIAERLLELPAGERETALHEACGGDDELLHEVAPLVLGPEPATGYLHPPTDDPTRHETASDIPEEIRNLGDFRLHRRIGAGGMGAVYHATQRSLSREVALKLLPLAARLRPADLERFRREARAIAALRHDSIVRIHAIDEAEGMPYFAMEYVDGHDLGEEIARQAESAPGCILPPAGTGEHVRAAVALLSAAADALDHAHEHGIVHRDVKPQNLLLDARGDVFVADFGVARDERFGTITGSRELMGSPHYMSPEQVAVGTTSVDRRTDVYSLGVVMYELLARRRPFDGATSVEVVDRIRKEEPRPLARVAPGVPRDLITICEKAMAREPRERYGTAAALRIDLLRFLDHQAPLAAPPGTRTRLRRWSRRHRRRLVPAAIVGAAVAATVLGRALWTDLQRARRINALEPPPRLEAPTWAELLAGWDANLELLVAVEQIRGEGGFLGLARRQLDSLEERARDEVIRLSRVAARRSRLRVADSGASSPVRVMSELGDILARALWTDRLLGEFDRPTPDLALDLFRPSLDLSRYPADATIRLHPIDPETGLPLRGAVPAEIPPGPRDAVPADLGRFRVIASTAPGRYAEDDVLLDRPIELRRLPAPRFVDLEDLRVSMVLHEAGTLRADAELPSPRPLWFQDRPPLLDVPAFLLDRHEVTNEDYRRFVLETGHRPPLYWPKGWRFAWEERWDRLPVSGVSVDDAEAFARWAGKRLPTALELEVAVRTHEGFASVRGGLLPVVPIGNVRSDARRRVAPNPFDLLQLGASEEDELRIRWTRYLLLVEPAGGTPGDRSPAGVLDLTGNVREWTSTPAVELGERVSVDTRGRVVSGSCFDHPLRHGAMVTTLRAHTRDESLGFRCAKTVLN